MFDVRRRSDLSGSKSNIFEGGSGQYLNSWLQDIFELGTFADEFSKLQPKMSFPKLNIFETGNNYIIDIAVAGYSKEDVDLELKDNSLFISVSQEGKKAKEDAPVGRYLIKEIASRKGTRVIKFPEEIEPSGIETSIENGIITCTLPKKAQKKNDGPLKIKIS